MRAMLVCRRRPVSAEEPGKTMNVLLMPVTLLEVEVPLMRNRETWQIFIFQLVCSIDTVL